MSHVVVAYWIGLAFGGVVAGLSLGIRRVWLRYLVTCTVGAIGGVLVTLTLS